MQQVHLPQLSYIHILENAGHMGMIEEPQKSIDYLQEFITAAFK
jgi:pimeloyl-ACP methyl ester carboxylesterase